MDDAVDNTRDHRRMAAKKPLGAFRDRVEYRLHVGRRTGDDLQDIGGRGLPLQRFLGLVEQPDVLDRDHGLVGEGLQQLDVVIGETRRARAA